MRPAVGELGEAPVHAGERRGGRVQRGHAALDQPEFIGDVELPRIIHAKSNIYEDLIIVALMENLK